MQTRFWRLSVRAGQHMDGKVAAIGALSAGLLAMALWHWHTSLMQQNLIAQLTQEKNTLAQRIQELTPSQQPAQQPSQRPRKRDRFMGWVRQAAGKTTQAVSTVLGAVAASSDTESSDSESIMPGSAGSGSSDSISV